MFSVVALKELLIKRFIGFLPPPKTSFNCFISSLRSVFRFILPVRSLCVCSPCKTLSFKNLNVFFYKKINIKNCERNFNQIRG